MESSRAVAGGLHPKHEASILGALGLMLLLAGWEAGGRLIQDPTFVSMPSLVARAAEAQIASGQLLTDSLVSLRELFLGFGLAALLGVPVGVAMGRYRLVEYALDPYMWFFYSAPIIAFYPLMIMWLGLGTPTIVALTLTFAIFPVVANTVTGVQQVDPALTRAARSFGGTPAQISWLVVLPAALPTIAAGLRLGIGRAMIGTIIGEFFGANAGLGFRIHLYGTEIRTSDMLVSVAVVMLIGVGLTQGLRGLESRLGSWRA